MTGLTHEERQAWPVIRKLIKRKPEMAAELLDGLNKEAAAAVLIKIRDELNILLQVNKAFSAVAYELAKMDKKEGESNEDKDK